MTDHVPLRDRAERLLAMARKAREEGHLDYAERFTQRAFEILGQPTVLERLGTQSCTKATEPPSRNALAAIPTPVACTHTKAGQADYGAAGCPLIKDYQ